MTIWDNVLMGGHSLRDRALVRRRAAEVAERFPLVDELSLGLAPLVVHQIFDTLKRLKEDGLSILLVEQNTRQALGLSRRGYVLENGRIVLAGTGPELLGNAHVRRAYLGM